MDEPGHLWTHAERLASEGGLWPTDTVSYGYHPSVPRLLTALTVQQPSGSWSQGYGYDAGWNMTERTVNGWPTAYTVNDLNQVTGIGGLTATYDANGNRTSQVYDPNGPKTYTYTYDDENRLVRMETDTYYTPEEYRWRTEFTYDGLGRLRKRVESIWYYGGWEPMGGETRYLYDGMRVVQERSSGNVPTVACTRGPDLSGSLEGAGGIGGLLARSHGYSGGSWTTHSFYHANGGGNVTCLINVSQAIVASYKYDPYGRVLSLSGSLATANVYRFSSKEIHPTSGLYYYGFRFFDPNTQRWLNRDPIGELAGINLYGPVANNPLCYIDAFGLEIIYHDSEAGQAAKMAITYLKNKLPSGAALRTIIDDLEKSKCTVKILPMQKGQTVPGHEPTLFGNSRITLDYRRSGYTRGDRHWTYRQALADELLHAWWWIVHGKTWDHGDSQYDDMEAIILGESR